MRYIPTNHLKKNMVLGQDIYDATGMMLLSTHTTLSEENISYLAFLGVKGVYIDDACSKTIDIKTLVRPEIENTAVQAVHDMFTSALGEQLDVSEEERRIRRIVEETVKDVLKNEQVMCNLIELKTYDGYTYFHSVHVGILAGIIAAKMHLGEDEIHDVIMAGFLHDMGKIFIDADLINAPRRLTEDERVSMMEHPRRGYEFLTRRFHFPSRVNRAVLEHHEWYNGMGYPEHKRENQLLNLARILKAADVYDAMTSKRPYHQPYLPSEVMEYIMGRSGMEFDPRVVEVMARELCIYPVGCEIELSNGKRAIVKENHKGYVLRPTIQLLDTENLIDLRADREARNLTIVKLMM